MENHAAELTRAISELDLNTLVPRAVAKNGQRYSKEQLLSLRPAIEKHEEHMEHVEFVDGEPGVVTPIDQHPRAPPPTPEQWSQTPDDSRLDEDGMDGDVDEGGEPKKKKKKKRSGKTKKPNPTGFEEFYADPPITPDEYEEECDLYAETRPFHKRIETCIQRYRARRKLDEVRSNIFTKYLMLGGVEAATHKQFTGGLDEDTLEKATAAEIAAIQATDFIGSGSTNAKFYNPSNSENWVVDFTGIVKGFLSYRVPRLLPIETEKDLKTYCNTIRNFLNYVLAHAVCPEYTQDVLAARKICEVAEKELWAIKQVRHRLPGHYNIAASTLYGGHYKGLCIGNQPWATDDPNFEDYVTVERGFSEVEADRIFKTAIAFAGTEELYLKVMNGAVHVVKTEIRAFEVVKIVRADLKTLREYATVKDHEGVAGNSRALGVIKFKAWEGPGLEEEDMMDVDEAETVNAESPIESFWLEDEALQHCFIGMKVELNVHELNIGVKYFDRVEGIYCSFFTVLPNEKMMNWKEPVPNTRPPPTEDDPEAEDKILEAIMEDEIKQDEKAFGERVNGDAKATTAEEFDVPSAKGQKLEVGMIFPAAP